MAARSHTLLPAIGGIIRRRILLNYAVDPAVVQPLLPSPFRPKLQRGRAIVGICLIRLEEMRPLWLPARTGMSSENAAHRMAVEWTADNGETREGVYIPRRETDSRFNHLVGGRLFPGEHHLADFTVEESGGEITFVMNTKDNAASIELKGAEAQTLPQGSVFASVDEASTFFEKGCDGYSPREKSDHVDAIRLCVDKWKVTPLEMEYVRSAYYDNRSIFPSDSIRLDHALIMRDIPHRWENISKPD